MQNQQRYSTFSEELKMNICYTLVSVSYQHLQKFVSNINQIIKKWINFLLQMYEVFIFLSISFILFYIMWNKIFQEF